MSGIVAFFGHRDTLITTHLENQLEQVVKELITNGYDEFWCCEQGNFDWLARTTMQRLKKENPNITLCYICAYNPNHYSTIKQQFLEERYELIYPPIATKGPQKFAISRRNKYIAENANVIVCYITRKSGGSYQAVRQAQQKQKLIINLAKTHFS